jgi:uncharacterized repeat protein (TIGR03803 family)
LKLAFAVLIFLSFGIVVCAQTTLVSFPCDPVSALCPDGNRPGALVQASDGNFYGTTDASQQGVASPQGGTVFKVTAKNSQLTLLFTFLPKANGKFTDGSRPNTLIEGRDGFLYGTAAGGGANNNGVLFKLSKSGTGFKILHSFCSLANCADGSTPTSLILGSDGNVYGSTIAGPSSSPFCTNSGCGTIFRTTLNGNLTILHTFTGLADGFQPLGIIQGADGNFYGTNSAGSPVMSGNVFSLTAAVEFAIVHTFTVYKAPISGLMQAPNSNLFGVFFDAARSRQQQLFEVSPSGSGFQQLPPFGPTTGTFPMPSPIQASDGNVWTSTFQGGASNDGTIVKMSARNGAVLQTISFNGANGSSPHAALVQGADGKIYGTTTAGGVVSTGEQPGGTVFSLNAGLAPPKPSIATITPTTGSISSTVILSGGHFVGTTSLKFNGVAAMFQVLNVDSVQATVPAGATNGLISVTNAGGTTVSTQSFIVN